MDARRLLSDYSTPHGAALIAVLVVIALALLAGCTPTERPLAASVAPPTRDAIAAIVVHEAADFVTDTAASVQQAVSDPVDDAQRSVALTIAPAIVAVQESVQTVLPPPASERGPVSSPVSPAAVALIVRHEIISEGYYAKALQGFACPGDRSGPTAGIGSDLGVQTRGHIREVWSIHPEVERMTGASGKVGFTPCRNWRTANKDIRTPLPLAKDVFATKLLPRYCSMAAKAFRRSWDRLPPDAQGGLCATVYVRGASLEDAPGSHMREEMRVIAYQCDADVRCIATQHRRMCTRFAGRKDQAGLCKRFNDTADLIERSAA